MTRRFTALALLAAMLVPVALYLPTLGYGFLFDDRPLLIDNPIVRSPRGLGEIMTVDLDPGARTSEAPATNYLRPLFVAVAVGLHNLFGDAPRGWHATAILVHGLLAGLAFLLLRREGLGAATALAAASFFALHPSHVQSTAWISGLQDLLFGTTALCAFLAYRRSLQERRPSWPRLLLLGAAFGVALLAKEPAVGLVIFVAAEALGMPAAPGAATTRRPHAELLVLLSVALAYFAYRWTVLGTLAHPFPTAPAWPVALASIPVTVLAYGKDLLWPVDLFLLHPARPVSGVVSRESLVAAVSVLMAIVGAVAGGRRWPVLIRPLCWTAAWLAPVLALWAVNPEWMVMDRYLLLPSLGLAWALAVLLPIDATRSRSRIAVWAFVLLACAGLSREGMRAFENEERFWSKAVAADPGSSTAWTEWGRKQAEANDLVAATRALERAVALDPRAQLPRLRLALLALRGGDASAAATALMALVERNPGYLPAWRNLIVAHARRGDSLAANRTLALALDRFPEDPVLWTQQAVLLRQDGRREEALAAVRRASTLAPDDPAAALREASLLAELGRGTEATAVARRGLQLAPTPEIKAALEALVR